MSEYQSKFETFFKSVFNPNIDAELFVIPATFALIHKRVELVSSCWLYNVEDKNQVKEIVKYFYIYYYLLKTRKNINMSTFVMETIKPETNYVNFHIDSSTMQLVRKDKDNEMESNGSCHELSSSQMHELWKGLQENSQIEEYFRNLSLELKNHQLLENGNFLDFNKLYEDTISKNLTDLELFDEGGGQNIIDVDFLLDNLLLYTFYSGFQYIYYIPTCLINKNSALLDRLEKGNGMFVVCSSSNLTDENIDYIKFIINGSISYAASDDIINLQSIAYKESLKSSKAAIMSRNMSHNLGSHVMFYIKQKLQSVSKIVDNKVLDNIIPGNIATIADIEEKIKANKDIELPFLVGLGRFINYLQERQDYIATIATDYIPANSTISFKDVVYDELKPDLRYERHYSQNNDAGWRPGNLLLDYIAYSERYRSCNDIKILFGEFDGRNPQEKGSPSDVDFKKLREFNIAVPGGVVGRQAIFSIFENIIRNAAKHSGRRNDNKLVLQLSLLGKDDNLFNSDDFKSIRNDDMVKYDVSGNILKAKYEECFDKYHVLRIKIDMPNDAKTVNKLVEKLADPYLEENGNMKESSKGLKEMRISAAWLRGYSIDTEIPANEPPALSIYTEPYDNSKVTISYIVCLPKPCKVAFVVECDNSDTVNGLLTPYGCKVFNDPFKLAEKKDCDKLINEIANYEIVCMPKNIEEQLCPFVSSRFIIDDNQSDSILTKLKNAIENPNYNDEDTKKDAIESCIGSIYEKWFKIAYNGVTPKLVVADGKAVDNKKAEKDNGTLSSDNNVILTATTSVTKEEVNEAVVYSTHFKGLATANDENTEPLGYNKMLEDAICIEPITGNNSTARLIRQDKWNKEWKIKLISAGIARIAIFDERIFSSFISQESTAHEESLDVETILKLKNKDLNDFKKVLLNDYKIPENVSGKIFYEKNQEKINKALEKYLTLYCNTHHDVAQKNHERRIYAFDIRNVNEKQINIIGYNVNIGERVGAYVNHEQDSIAEIAQITYDAKDVKVKLTDHGQKIFKVDDHSRNTNKHNGRVFDYITIHQGLLDKIYTAFGIKNDEDEKYKVTNALHQCFSKQDTPKEVKKFLPNFIIHSGRSKPSKNDMPQSQPFVQFAAIDSAVKDCKYTLVELLATAHYEKGNNNN